jgi:DNA primase
MAISKRIVELVRAHTYPSDIIGKYVNLRRKRKAMEWIGLCPFHLENSPSFTVTDSKSFYHCFGCGKHGKAHDFLMEFLNISYEEAMLEIADHYELQIPCGPTNVTKKKQKDRVRRRKEV